MNRQEFENEVAKLGRQIECERLRPEQIEDAIRGAMFRQEYWRCKGNKDEVRAQEKILDILIKRREYGPKLIRRHAYLSRWSLIFSDPKDWLYEGDASPIRIGDIFERSFRDPLPEAPPYFKPVEHHDKPAGWLIPPASPGPFLRAKFPHEDRCAPPFGRGVRCSDVMRAIIGH